MATSTTKLGLIKPDFTDVVDITDLNSNADDIDAAVGATIVTSTTRPTVPFAGQTIFETDTDSTLVWNGTAWKEVSSIADGSITAAKLATTAGAVMVFDDAAARTTAIPSPIEGMVTYLKDTDKLEKYTTDWVDAAPGKILQVVQTVKTNVFSTTSPSFTTVTGATVTITPRATSSKILLICNFMAGQSGTQSANFRLSGGNATTFVGDADLSAVRAAASHAANVAEPQYHRENMTIAYLDSPNTTSAITYALEANRGTAGTVFVGSPADLGTNENRARTPVSLIAMEVAG
jgi:hypothetical protein